MKTSKAGVDFIKIVEEGSLSRLDVVPPPKLHAYNDGVGVWTIGWGCTHGVYEGMEITAERAQEMIDTELVDTEQAVTTAVTVPLTQGQFDVLVSFAYNCGTGALRGSTLLKRLNAQNYAAVPAELMKWTHAGGREMSGLVARRRVEGARWDASSSRSRAAISTKENCMDGILGLLPIIRLAAPGIATALGGPLAGSAVAALASVLDTEATPTAVAAGVKALPADEIISTLAKAEAALVAMAPTPTPAQNTDHGVTMSLREIVVHATLVVLGAILVGSGKVSPDVWSTFTQNTVAVVGAVSSVLAGVNLLWRTQGTNANTVAAQR